MVAQAVVFALLAVYDLPGTILYRIGEDDLLLSFLVRQVNQESPKKAKNPPKTISTAKKGEQTLPPGYYQSSNPIRAW